MRHIHAVLATLVVASAIPPSAARAASATLRWTATGDDSLAGRAVVYDLRYNVVPVTSANFYISSRAWGMPAPSPSGTLETFTVDSLLNNWVYYFAIKTADEAGNWSGISNMVSKIVSSTVDVEPRAPRAIAFSQPRPNPASAGSAFEISLPGATPVEVVVFDVQGRRIRELATGQWPAGLTSLRWDLRGDNGLRMSAGTYLVRARLGDKSFTRRVVVTP